jgi:hypothetical protein
MKFEGIIPVVGSFLWKCIVQIVAQNHEIVGMGKIKNQTDLFIEHIAVEALGAQQGDMMGQALFFHLGRSIFDLGLGDTSFQRKQGHDAMFSLDRVISEIDDGAHADQDRHGTS